MKPSEYYLGQSAPTKLTLRLLLQPTKSTSWIQSLFFNTSHGSNKHIVYPTPTTYGLISTWYIPRNGLFCSEHWDAGSNIANMAFIHDPRAIQLDTEVVIGWLQWSFREVDAKVLAIGLNNDYDINISLRWSTIRIGTYNKKEQQVKALHIVTEAENVLRTSQILNKVYHQTRNSFPFGIHMRFVPCSAMVSDNMMNRLNQCRSEQTGLLN